jgi:sigma-E factor negative regulatory protein RseC
VGDIYQVGIVREIVGDKVEVEIARTTACGGNCAGCKAGCSGTGITVRLENRLNARARDIVRIRARSGSLVLSAAFTYLLPLVMLVLGMVYGGAYLQRLYPGMGADTAGLVFGVFALALYYFVIRLAGGRLGLTGRNKPEIVEVINR